MKKLFILYWTFRGWVFLKFAGVGMPILEVYEEVKVMYDLVFSSEKEAE